MKWQRLKKKLTEIKNAFDELICRLDIADEKISEILIKQKTNRTKMRKKVIQMKNKRISKDYLINTRGITQG